MILTQKEKLKAIKFLILLTYVNLKIIFTIKQIPIKQR